MSGHWKIRKPKWVIELRESSSLVWSKTGNEIFSTRKAARDRAKGLCLYEGEYRVVKVWIKFEEVQP